VQTASSAAAPTAACMCNRCRCRTRLRPGGQAPEQRRFRGPGVSPKRHGQGQGNVKSSVAKPECINSSSFATVLGVACWVLRVGC
jgi:hypothetical protein